MKKSLFVLAFMCGVSGQGFAADADAPKAVGEIQGEQSSLDVFRQDLKFRQKRVYDLADEGKLNSAVAEYEAACEAVYSFLSQFPEDDQSLMMMRIMGTLHLMYESLKMHGVSFDEEGEE